MNDVGADIRSRAAKIKLLVLDVDGVLTDGTLFYSAHGEEIKSFNVKDGLGIRLLQESGVEVAVISAKESAPLARRMADLMIRHYFPGESNKVAAYDKLLARFKLSDQETAYVGDDVIDLPVMRRVGLAVSVRDGHDLVKAEAHWVTELAGGRGAVREVVDLLLESRAGLVSAGEGQQP